MRHRLDCALCLTGVPLLLAIAALVVREVSRPAPPAEPAAAIVVEYRPPLAYLAAARDPGHTADFSVERARSTATAVGPSADRARRFRVSGGVRILADDSLAGFDLVLARPAGQPAHGWPPDLELHVRGAGAQGRGTAIPGVRAADVRCSIVLGGVTHEAVLAATWIRLPGGAIELHGVVPLDGSRLDLLPASPWRMLVREDVGTLGIDAVLRTEG